MIEATYLIYLIIMEGFIFYGAYYAVFKLNRSAWWFALALYMAGNVYTPERWIHGKIEEDSYLTRIEKTLIK